MGGKEVKQWALRWSHSVCWALEGRSRQASVSESHTEPTGSPPYPTRESEANTLRPAADRRSRPQDLVPQLPTQLKTWAIPSDEGKAAYPLVTPDLDDRKLGE